ncbi:peptidyl-dipeptidase Dcp [Paludibacter propionicigenes WB4]|uniref:Peptidyl-dipeptidase Dcp n=1 Tax=Paludibacter propionicigenes (strain DSM 17365 / JCM 13257 / WB4) TaxID=694427 RepID=E4T841_PALPW|nr:M3 family metallopeptidase [Paludibacter propionicigenes]ADQ80885.1 peptidyl-dipeptidase Dcp [Paludibacter propionicigenes WB4]
MKKILLTLTMGILLMGCAKNDNPFFETYKNKYGAPPFDKIKNEHYMPAFKEGIKKHQAEIDSIAESKDAPTFDNTIAAMDFSGELLKKVSSVFFNLYSSNTNKEMDKIANEISPILSEHNDNIYLNEKLFARVKTLYDNRSKLGLTAEQNRLLEKYHRNFIRSGAALNPDQKAKLREINKELGLAEIAFGQNVLEETNSYQKVVDNEDDLAGLPESVRQAAAEAAKEAKKEGKWIFTTQKASFIPVLQYSENRELRKELLMAYSTRANHNNAKDNKAVINKIMKLRTQKAQLLGFANSAEFILDDTMAKTPKTVYDFLATVWTPALAKAKEEAAELQKLMDAEGKGEKLEAWDWWYYSEKLRKAKYNLDEESLKPYFKLENVRQGVFDLASKLYGLKFKKLKNMPVYHPDVEVFEVDNADGSLVGILYTDYFPRAGKRAGAWMNNITEQYVKDGVDHRPIICNIGNFTKPTADKPSLLNMDEVETLFHEFGHALHGLLTKCTYPSMSGTNVSRDFVELPSQVMENWCWEPEVMKTYARHYKTNEIMPKALMDKIQKAGTFNQGFVNTELLAASLLDMDYHMIKDTTNFDVDAFEKASLARMGMIPEIIVRYRSSYFNHIFGGGYSAGYYSYTWAAVLDADAFQAFKETGDIYNPKVATAFRKKLLEKGDSEDPMKLYRDFRGANPNPDALLKKRGLK